MSATLARPGAIEGLRPVRDGDAAALAHLVGTCFAEYEGCVLDLETEEVSLNAPATWAAAHHGTWWVVERAGVVGASVAIYPKGPEAELKKLYLLPAFRGAGLATALVALAEDTARSAGARRVTLWSDTRFLEAHRLYRRLGYVQGGTRALHDLSDTVEFFFARELAP